MSSSGKKQTTLFQAFKITTGKGTRPALTPFGEMEDRFKSGPKAFPILDTHDENQTRLMSAMQAAQSGYFKTDDVRMRAGYVNEARQYQAVLEKYGKMRPEEKADRVYLPQMSLFHEGREDRFRVPDMIKLKRTRSIGGTESFHASVIEFKSNVHEPEQRALTMGLIADQSKLLASPGVPWKTDEHYNFHHAPVTKFKTRFSGQKPDMTEPTSMVTSSFGGSVIKGTAISVTNKQDPSK